jgi:parvulin-like peptidyl-prolyl isomerase
MTFRSSSAARPSRRRTNRNDSRRTILISVTFVAAIGVSLSLVAGVFAAAYYGDHGAAVSSVNGEAISKDAVRDRVAMKIARDKRLVQDYVLLRNRGQITSDEYNALAATPTNDETSSTLYSDSLTALQNEAELRQYAAKNGITITDQQVNDQLKIDGAIPEMRHVLVIGVAPQPVPPANSPTSQDLQAAQAKAQGFHDEIKNGKSWTDVTTEVKAIQGGNEQDIGMTAKAGLTLEPDITEAIFGLAKPNDITDVFKGTDGIYRFATVTSISAAYADQGWQQAMSGDYQNFVRGLAVTQAVTDAVNKKYIDSPTVQRHVLEIAIGTGYGQPGNGDEVKISLMVFAPNHSESGASGVAASDPAWADAKARADTAVATLRADPSKFDSMARDTTTNDDTNWNTAGGSIPWIPADLFNAQTQGGYTGLGLNQVQAIVFSGVVTPGTILDPIQETSQGWVVVKFEGLRAAPLQRIADAQLEIATGTDFATVAGTESESADAAAGGDLGWVSPYQLNPAQEQAIFSTPIGRVTNMVTASNGYYVYKVVEEQTRTPEASQAAKLKAVVYHYWLAELTAKTNIWTDSAGLSALNPAASPT